MLAAEATLLLLLRRRRAETLRLGLTVPSTAQRLAWVLTTELFAGRRRARQLAVERMRRELRAIGADDVAENLGRSGNASEALDALRARRGAEAIAGRWARAAASGEATAYREAAAKTDWVLRSAAGTENSTAFSAERRSALFGVSSRVELWKVWDATLDKRVCLVCAGAHGTVVRVGESFPQGRPGDVHNLCRCLETIVPVELTEPVKRAA